MIKNEHIKLVTNIGIFIGSFSGGLLAVDICETVTKSDCNRVLKGTKLAAAIVVGGTISAIMFRNFADGLGELLLRGLENGRG